MVFGPMFILIQETIYFGRICILILYTIKVHPIFILILWTMDLLKEYLSCVQKTTFFKEVGRGFLVKNDQMTNNPRPTPSKKSRVLDARQIVFEKLSIESACPKTPPETLFRLPKVAGTTK